MYPVKGRTVWLPCMAATILLFFLTFVEPTEAQACLENQLKSEISTCQQSCCGSSGCECSPTVCSASGLAAGTCRDYSGFASYCSYNSCYQTAVTRYSCEASTSSYYTAYVTAVHNITTCNSLSVSKGCTYSQMEAVQHCVKSLSCMASNTSACTSDCYKEVLQCLRNAGCTFSTDVYPYCKSHMGSFFPMCSAATQPCAISGGSAECTLNHYARCVDLAAAATTPTPGSPPSSSSSSSSGMTAVVIVLSVLFVVVVGALVMIIALLLSKMSDNVGGKPLQPADNRASYQEGASIVISKASESPEDMNGSFNSGDNTIVEKPTRSPNSTAISPVSFTSTPTGNPDVAITSGGPGSTSSNDVQPRRSVVSPVITNLTPPRGVRSSGGSNSKGRGGLGRTSIDLIDKKRLISITKQLQAGEWQRGKMIGKGSSGTVYSCILSDGSFVALKQLDAKLISVDDAKQLSEELRLMANLHNPHIIRYFHAEFNEDSREINLWMEFVHGGSLGALVKKLEDKLTENVVRVYTRQIVLGLKYLHTNHIVHRDIKADNILIEADGRVKLADFGSAKSLFAKSLSMQPGPNSAKATMPPSTMTKYTDTIVGTPLWMAPEVVNPENPYSEGGYNTKCDVWSLGITVCELLNRGTPPWPEFASAWAALFHIGNLEEAPSVPECSETCKTFVEMCLQIDPKKRATATELLAHPWLAEADSSFLDSTDESSGAYSFEFTDAIRRLQGLGSAVLDSGSTGVERSDTFCSEPSQNDIPGAVAS